MAFDLLTTFERRQRLLALLQQQPGIRVPELASLLGVSQGTIRNDFNALAESGQLTRVRGGAALPDGMDVQSLAFAARAHTNELAKLRIARGAAELVEDGDAILIDASTTAFHIAPFLDENRNLTVVTNGIDAARRLAKNPSNTVILLGGVVREDGSRVSGPLSEVPLADLHIKTAFVSGTGFSLEAGLTEVDIDEALLKRKMIATARSVVALVDSSKFGKVDLTPIARTEQISHMMTDSDLPAHWVEQLRQTCIVLTVCDEATTSSYTPWAIAAGHYRIGFASLGEQVPFATEVRRGIERAAAEAGNVDLFLADNQLDGKIALQVADHLLQRELDLVIEFQLDARAGDVLMAKFRQAGVPVIAVDIPMVGATFFGADNYTSGEMAGTALGAWIREHWGGEMDELIVLEEARAGLLPGARIRGQMDGLQSQVGVIPVEIIRHVDSSNTAEYTESQMRSLLGRMVPTGGRCRIAAICFNDDAAVGAIAAARHRSGAIAHDGLGLEMVIVGQGADRRARAEMRRPGSPLIGSTAFRPEKYGDGLIALARSILRREPVPPATYVDHVFITPYNVDGYYPEA